MLQYTPFVIVIALVIVVIIVLRAIRQSGDCGRKHGEYHNGDPIGQMVRFFALVAVFFVLIMVLANHLTGGMVVRQLAIVLS